MSNDGIVLIANDVGFTELWEGWVSMLGAALDPAAEYELQIGKTEEPDIRQGTHVYLVRDGLVRCMLEASGRRLGVQGWSAIFTGQDIVRAKGVYVDPAVISARWREVMKKAHPPEPLWFYGWRERWWQDSDEKDWPFPRWVLYDFEIGPMRDTAHAYLNNWPKNLAAPAAHATAQQSGQKPRVQRAQPKASPDAGAHQPAAPVQQVNVPSPNPPASPGQRSLF